MAGLAALAEPGNVRRSQSVRPTSQGSPLCKSSQLSQLDVAVAPRQHAPARSPLPAFATAPQSALTRTAGASCSGGSASSFPVSREPVGVTRRGAADAAGATRTGQDLAEIGETCVETSALGTFIASLKQCRTDCRGDMRESRHPLQLDVT